MTPDADLLRRFLLGTLPEGEHARLQEAFFTDAGLHARVVAAEDDLFDAYARGELSDDERACFEERFGAQQQRVRFAELLAKSRM
ncbi:MAG TPA: hypothetical protein VGF48_09510 [Thermoanaerobaculia bacterium]|jgi:hypothetical protein